MENDDAWELEDGAVPSTSLNGRAHNYLLRFDEAGWLLEERAGLLTVVSMPVAASRFMEALQAFIEFSPPALGARMRGGS
ncbi:Wadjet anti-phage system protein JetA family protein [Lysobacter sp. GCM10012299]|uniref:Wadjet anti-phage system protein JetA family protein n=1 Tax=Lysobacter sp. GCM10012299 TaxID=3317333 RepID=UPI003607EF03